MVIESVHAAYRDDRLSYLGKNAPANPQADWQNLFTEINSANEENSKF